jgi:DNA mismatch endonuclease (patch repair protein)
MLTTDPATSMRMSRTRGRDNSLERQLRSALFKKGFRFRIHYRGIDGTKRTIDIAFPKGKVAAFVNGCFWHGCPIHGTWPKRNSEFWQQKIQSNKARDRDTDHRLKELGWSVVRIWEHQSLEEAVGMIAVALATAGRNASRATLNTPRRARGNA